MLSKGSRGGFNILSPEISFTDGASTSIQFDETYAPEIYAGAAYVKGLYVTEWTGAEMNGGINIQNGTSTTESSNSNIIVCDLSTGDIGTPANGSMGMAKVFSFSGGLQISSGLHISTTADLGSSNVIKVRLLYETMDGQGAFANVNKALHSYPEMLVSSELSYTDSASTTSQFDEAYSVAIRDDKVILHSLVITEWAGLEINGGLRVQNGTSTTIANNTNVINLDLSTGVIGSPANGSMNIQKSWDFPGGIFFDKGLHIGTTADLGASNEFKIQVVYEPV